MVGKTSVLAVYAVLAIMALFALPVAVSAAECGDGVCEPGEGCVSCQADCGACDGAMCFIDSNCASNICCDGVCGGSCVTYAQTEGLGDTGMFLSNPVNVVMFLGILIAIVAGAIVYAVYFRKKRAPSAVSDAVQKPAVVA
jgi:hypothetical protein